MMLIASEGKVYVEIANKEKELLTLAKTGDSNIYKQQGYLEINYNSSSFPFCFFLMLYTRRTITKKDYYNLFIRYAFN